MKSLVLSLIIMFGFSLSPSLVNAQPDPQLIAQEILQEMLMSLQIAVSNAMANCNENWSCIRDAWIETDYQLGEVITIECEYSLECDPFLWMILQNLVNGHDEIWASVGVCVGGIPC